MGSAIVFLLILCIWPVGPGAPQVIYTQAPTMEICEAAGVSARADLEADPKVAFVSSACIELNKGSKA